MIKLKTIVKNKTFISWCKYNCLILVLGTSLILNITYLSKVLNVNSNQNNITTNINIIASNGKTIVLPKTTYITTFNSLGNLLSACPSDFEINKTQFGRLLTAVKGVKATNNKFWEIEYWNGNSFIAASTGIDNIRLVNNDFFRFNLITFATTL